MKSILISLLLLVSCSKTDQKPSLSQIDAPPWLSEQGQFNYLSNQILQSIDDQTKVTQLLTSQVELLNNHIRLTGETKEQTKAYFLKGIKFKHPNNLRSASDDKNPSKCKEEAVMTFLAGSITCMALGTSVMFSVLGIPCAIVNISKFTLAMRQCLREQYPRHQEDGIWVNDEGDPIDWSTFDPADNRTWYTIKKILPELELNPG